MQPSTPLRRKSRIALLLLFLSALGSGAHAQSLAPGYPADVRAYDPREVATLPAFCIYTQEFRDKVPGGSDQDQIKHWYAVMGEPFHAMHHYCWGLMKTHRALVLARTRQAREFYLNDAIGEFDYVLDHSTPSFLLFPEILARKGQNLIRLGKGPLAILQLERAIEIKPDYWPAYAYLSDYHKDSGDYDQAKALVQAALIHAPEVKGLHMRLAELEKLDRKAIKPSKK